MEYKNIKNKILLVLTRFPYPANDGTKERILGEIKALGANFEVSLLIISDETIQEQSRETLSKLITGEIFIFKLSKVGCYLHSILNLFTHNPLQIAYYFRNKSYDWLKKNGQNYKIIHFHTIRFGQYIYNLKKDKSCQNTKLLLCFNDSISLNYKSSEGKFFGLWSLIYYTETSRIKEYELKILKTADGFSIVSKQDKEYIQNNWKEKYKDIMPPQITVIHNGIDDYLFNYNYNPQTNNLVFIGNLFYPPNRQGLLFFCKNIWPSIILKKPEIKLIIIGRGGKEFFQKVPNAEILGYVKDPYKLMTEQAIFISPAYFGSGVPTKSLLAMALGLPVISTINNAIGIEGSIDNENIYLIDYNLCKEAADKIISIIENENDRKRIGASGKNLVRENYRQSITYPKLKSFIEEYL